MGEPGARVEGCTPFPVPQGPKLMQPRDPEEGLGYDVERKVGPGPWEGLRGSSPEP